MADSAKVIFKVSCPDCNNLAGCESWSVRGKNFEWLYCRKCSLAYGRINRGNWILMSDRADGEATPDGQALKLSRRG